jgi:hypothetical protein
VGKPAKRFDHSKSWRVVRSYYESCYTIPIIVECVREPPARRRASTRVRVSTRVFLSLHFLPCLDVDKSTGGINRSLPPSLPAPLVAFVGTVHIRGLRVASKEHTRVRVWQIRASRGERRHPQVADVGVETANSFTCCRCVALHPFLATVRLCVFDSFLFTSTMFLDYFVTSSVFV